MNNKIISTIFAAVAVCAAASAQTYPAGIIDKTVAVIGGEMISISDIESEIQMLNAQGMSSDKSMRCEVLETILRSKLFLVQARLDSLTVNNDLVDANMSQRLDQILTQLGGEEEVEAYFHKPIYKLRQEWRATLQEQSLTQQEQQKVADEAMQLTPMDIKAYSESLDPADLPIVPIKYQISQICVYPDREAAASAVKERLLAIRERIINGERFGTMARLYSQDPGSARRGGELGMASKNIFWPAFSDAAMSLKKGIVSQIVETPDGFHIIEVLDKKGDMFNARHILLQPEYTSEDRKVGFERLDSLRNEILEGNIEFGQAARFFSEDLPTRTNMGQMADPNTGSSYFEIDQLKPQDYAAIKDLKEGEISQPVESLDNEGRSGNLVYKILRVDKIIPAHTATYNEDYDLLMTQAKMEQQKELINKFIDEKIKTTRIVIDPIFSDCEFENPQWKEKIRK